MKSPYPVLNLLIWIGEQIKWLIYKMKEGVKK